MTSVKLLDDLARLGIQLQAHGDKLRYALRFRSEMLRFCN